MAPPPQLGLDQQPDESPTKRLVAFLLIGVSLAVIVILAVKSFNDSTLALDSTIAGVPQCLEPTALRGGVDEGAELGECIRVDGIEISLLDSTSLPEQPTSEPTLIITISAVNRSSTSKSFGAPHWRLRSPQGTVAEPILDPSDRDDALGLVEVATGETVQGTLAFEYTGPGRYFVVYKPVLSLGSDQGVWGITVP